MNQQLLKDNFDLYQFLCKLAQELRRTDHVELAENIETASLFANGSPSEFLHEAQVTLEQVERARPEQIDITQIRFVIAQIKEAFRKIGGA